MSERIKKQSAAIDTLRAFINGHSAMNLARELNEAHEALTTILDNCAEHGVEQQKNHEQIVAEYEKINRELNEALGMANDRITALQEEE